jgi:hypothetical protein
MLPVHLFQTMDFAGTVRTNSTLVQDAHCWQRYPNEPGQNKHYRAGQKRLAG